MSTRSGLLLHRATVQSIEHSGVCHVRIPALSGGQTVPVDTVGLGIDDLGQFITPGVGSVGYVASNCDLSQFSWVTLPLEDISDEVHFLMDYEDSQEPIGIDGSSSLTVSNRTITITPTGVSFDVWIHAKRYAITTARSVTVPDVTGLYFVIFNTLGVLSQSTTPFDLSQVACVATFYWNATDQKGVLGDERHKVVMDWATHLRLHRVDGAQFVNGGVISGFAIGAGNDTNAGISFALSSGTQHDEDIQHAINALADGGPYMLAWRDGVSSWRWTTTATTPVLTADYTPGAAFIEYNQFTGGGWQRTAVINGDFLNYYVLSTNIISPAGCQYVVVPGQSKYTTLSDALAESVLTLNLTGFESQEFAAIYQITFRAGTAFGSSGRCRIEANPVRIVGTRLSITSSITPTSHTALTNRSDTDSHPATAITYTPLTPWTAINVQTQLDALGLAGAGAPGGTGIQGQTYWDTTNKRLYVSDGSGWVIMSEPAITTFVPTISAHSGTITTVGAVSFAYHRCDGYLDWEASITITTNGTGATNVHMTIPVDPALNTCMGYGRENGVTGNMLEVIFAGGGVAWIQNYNNTYPAGNGYVLGVAGRYRMASRYS